MTSAAHSSGGAVARGLVRQFAIAGLLGIAFQVLALAANRDHLSAVLRANTIVGMAIATIAAAALLVIAVSGRSSERQRLLAQIPAGLLAGLYANPSSGAILALAVAGLALSAAPRSRFWVAAVLFVASAAGGMAIFQGLAETIPSTEFSPP